MTELISIKDLPKSTRQQLLEELGHSIKGNYVVDSKGNYVLDRYTKEKVMIDNMVILPGSTIILDNNPLSISAYLEDFGDVL